MLRRNAKTVALVGSMLLLFVHDALNARVVRPGIPRAEKSAANNSTKTKSDRSIALPPEKAVPIKVPRFDQPPVIAGKLDDEVWRQAVKLKDFYQTTPGDNIAPSQPTEVFPGYDSKISTTIR